MSIEKKKADRKTINIRRIVSGEIGLVLILLLLVVMFTLLSEHFFVGSNLLNVTRQISVNLIVAIGMTFVIISGEIDLSVGSIAAFAGVVTAATITATGSIALGIIAGILAGAAIGLINGILTVYGKVQSFIVTLATMGIIRGVVLVWTDGKPISHLPDAFDVYGAGYVGPVPVSTLIALGIFIITFIVLSRTKHGTYIKSIGANQEAARLSAIPVNRYRLTAFGASGLFSAIGGILITSRLLSAQPTAGEGMEMDVIAAVILGGASLAGGIGTVLGTLLGAAIIGVIDNGMNLMDVSAFFQQIVKGVIILVAVLAKRDK